MSGGIVPSACKECWPLPLCDHLSKKVLHSCRPACVLCVSPAADHGRDPTMMVTPDYSSTQGAQLELFGKSGVPVRIGAALGVKCCQTSTATLRTTEQAPPQAHPQVDLGRPAPEPNRARSWCAVGAEFPAENRNSCLYGWFNLAGIGDHQQFAISNI